MIKTIKSTQTKSIVFCKKNKIFVLYFWPVKLFKLGNTYQLLTLFSGFGFIIISISYLASAGSSQEIQNEFSKSMAYVFINLLCGVAITAEVVLALRMRKKAEHISRHVSYTNSEKTIWKKNKSFWYQQKHLAKLNWTITDQLHTWQQKSQNLNCSCICLQKITK